MAKIYILFILWLSITVAHAITNDTIPNNNSENEDLTTPIINFWKEQDQNFHLETSKDIVLLFGDTGHGISTTSLFLVGTELEAIEVFNRFAIVDRNGRIGYAVSKPEMLNDTGVTYYDCPGFGDERGAEYEIPKTLLMNKLLNSVNSFKLVLVVDYMTIEFPYLFGKLIEQALEVFKNFENFSDGIAMVVTKVPNDYQMENVTSFLSDDARMIEKVVESLKKMINIHREYFNSRQLKLIQILLEKRMDKYQRIGIIRRPELPGPLMQMEVFQNERILLNEIIQNNIKYVRKGDAEFGHYISFNSKREIRNIIRHELFADLSSICFEIEQFYLQQERDNADIFFLDDLFEKAHQNFSEIQDNNVCSFMEKIVNAINTLEINVSINTMDRVTRHIENVAFLNRVSDQNVENSILLEHRFKGVIDKVERSLKWYDFLIYLDKEFSKNNSYTDETKVAAIDLRDNCFIDETQMRSVSDIGLNRFLNLANIDLCYHYVKDLRVNAFQLKALTSVLSVFWQ